MSHPPPMSPSSPPLATIASPTIITTRATSLPPPPLPERKRSGEVSPKMPPTPSTPGASSSTSSMIGNKTPPPPPTPTNQSLSAVTSPHSRNSSISSMSISKLSFSSLTHLYDDLDDQCETGFQSVKLMASLSKKLVAAQEKFAKSVLEIIDSEFGKSSASATTVRDAARDSMSGFESILAFYRQSAQLVLTQAQSLQSQVVAPLTDCSVNTQSRLKDLRSEQKRVEKDMAQAHSDVQTEFQSCTKLLEQLTTSSDNGTSSGSGSGSKSGAQSQSLQQSLNAKTGALFKSLQSRIESMTLSTPAAMQDKLVNHSKKYQQSIERANKYQSSYLSTDLPHVLTAMESLERDRIQCINNSVRKFSVIHTEALPQTEKLLGVLANDSSKLNDSIDIHTFVADLLSKHGPAPAPTVYQWSLPITIDDIRNQRYTRNPNSIFHTTLQHCLELSSTTVDGLTVPKIVEECLTGVRANNGLQCEGIFRLSPSKAEFDTALKAIENESNYSVLRHSDPHLHASMLKNWLRSLTVPLINDTLYNQAIEIAKIDCAQPKSAPANALVVYEQCDQNVKSILLLIARLVHEAVLEANSSQSKMSYESFSIVFAPCFLRCNSTDPAIIFANTRFETRFTRMLLQALSDRK